MLIKKIYEEENIYDEMNTLKHHVTQTEYIDEKWPGDQHRVTLNTYHLSVSSFQTRCSSFLKIWRFSYVNHINSKRTTKWCMFRIHNQRNRERHRKGKKTHTQNTETVQLHPRIKIEREASIETQANQSEENKNTRATTSLHMGERECERSENGGTNMTRE